MSQLTITGLDEDLNNCVRQLAKREGISLEHAALEILREGAGLAGRCKPKGLVGDSLDHLMGTWTHAEVEELNAAIEDFEIIDEEAREGWLNPGVCP